MTTIFPWLSVPDTAVALAFYTSAFAATEIERMEDDAGNVVVAQLAVDGAGFWVQHDPEVTPDGTTVRMILSVDDPDAVFAAAVDAGATVIAPVYEGHGWRVGRIADPSGHQWEIGRPLAAP